MSTFSQMPHKDLHYLKVHIIIYHVYRLYTDLGDQEVVDCIPYVFATIYPAIKRRSTFLFQCWANIETRKSNLLFSG